MVEVHNLEERLDTRSFVHLLLWHRLGDFQGFARNSSYNSMAVLPGVDTVIESLDNHALLARIAPIQNNHNLTGLQAAKKLKLSEPIKLNSQVNFKA
jgi:hypothetical protein